MIVNGVKLDDVKADKTNNTELSERDNKIIGWCSLALATMLLIAFFLGGFFSPVKAHAGELVGENLAGSQFDNYVVAKAYGEYFLFVSCDVRYNGDDSSGIWLYITGADDDGVGYKKSFSSLEDVEVFLNSYSGDMSVFDKVFSQGLSNSTLIYSSYDIKHKGSDSVFFQRAPLETGHPTVGGLQAPEIATALTSQIVGLVPLVLGLLVLAIGLWKGLKHLRQMLSRA